MSPCLFTDNSGDVGSLCHSGHDAGMSGGHDGGSDVWYDRDNACRDVSSVSYAASSACDISCHDNDDGDAGHNHGNESRSGRDSSCCSNPGSLD